MDSIAKTAPYGAWPSLISASLISGASAAVSQPTCDNGNTYWLESRPQENGRTTLMEKNQAGTLREVLPAPLSIRSTIHEYGGRAYLINAGILYFCLEDDQRVYRLPIQGGTHPEPLTPDCPSGELRFADFRFDHLHNRLLCVCEDHRAQPEPENVIAAIDLDTPLGEPQKLVSGDDFYAFPRLSPNGEQLCWISWNHPDMPWDNTRLWLADCDTNGNLHDIRQIAGGDNTAIFQPEWSPDGELFYVSDRDNWWNLYRGDHRPLHSLDAEFATPLWTLDMSTYGFLDAGHILCCYTQNAHWHLAIITVDSGELTPVACNYTHIHSLTCDDGNACFVAANPLHNPVIVSYQAGDLTVIAGDLLAPVPTADLSQPTHYRYPTTVGDAHLLYYPPTNAEFIGSPDELPPLIIICHGGPTGMSAPTLNFKIQFWTNRGFAVADINYRGSTGFGRKYRDSLHYQWGIADVEDAVNGAKFLAEQGLADPDRTLIRGSSAGGYTVLAALAFSDYFKAGACLYGIGDLETLARDTHKFESRYLDKLIGDYPEQRDIYRERSPINHIDKVTCPVIFFQGLNDKVVPPQQTLDMVNALRTKKLPVACLLFEGEAHGFRKAKTIEQSLQAELYFYAKVFSFAAPPDCPPIHIENLNDP